MKALVVCPTYGRLHHLGKLLASFLSQTYQDKHLVIINDDKNITLNCEFDDVTIINLNKKISVGEKRNLGAAYGHFDIIHPWDDDDIFLPKRLENYMKEYDDPDIYAYRNYPSYIIYNNKFSPSNGSINAKSYRKKHFFDIGGYSTINNFGEDLELHLKLQKFKKTYNEDNRDFIYGFSTSNLHLSNQPSEENICKNAFNYLKDMNLLNKIFNIEPDYDEYSKYLKLDTIFKKSNVDNIPLKILPFGKIDIL